MAERLQSLMGPPRANDDLPWVEAELLEGPDTVIIDHATLAHLVAKSRLL
jgi:hypothetical protein